MTLRPALGYREGQVRREEEKREGGKEEQREGGREGGKGRERERREEGGSSQWALVCWFVRKGLPMQPRLA